MSGKFIGKAGSLAVMAEFLLRGWNVATPEGGDFYVVRDDNGEMKRVQVKSANAENNGECYSGFFTVSSQHLNEAIRNKPINVYYIFIVRVEKGWNMPLIIRADYLHDHFSFENPEALAQDTISLYISYSNEKVLCYGQDFSKYICDYTDFPVIPH